MSRDTRRGRGGREPTGAYSCGGKKEVSVRRGKERFSIGGRRRSREKEVKEGDEFKGGGNGMEKEHFNPFRVKPAKPKQGKTVNLRGDKKARGPTGSRKKRARGFWG